MNPAGGPARASATAPSAPPGLRAWLSLPLVIMLAGTLLPGPWLWSADHLAYLALPRWLAVLWPLAALAALWSPAADRGGAWLVRTAEPALLGRPAVAYAVIPLGGAILCWLVRAATPLLGDGLLIASMLSEGDRFHGFDFLSFHLHARLVALLGIGDLAAALRLLALTSALTGAAYLAAAAWSSRRLARRPGEAILLFGLLLLAAPLLLFCGYAECYAQLAVCLLLAGSCLRLYLDGRGSLLAAAAWFAAGLFWHLNALLLAPVLVAAAVWPARRDGAAAVARRLATVAWPSLLALALAAAVLGLGGYERGAVVDDFFTLHPDRPLLNTLTGPRGLTDWRLWKDLANLALLLAPVPVVLLAAGLRRRRATAAAVILAGGALWVLLLAAVINLKLGPVRDWDLLAGQAVLAALAAGAAWQARELDERARHGLVGAALIAALAVTAPWIALNASETAASRRLEQVTVDLPGYPRSLAMEDLARWRREQGDLAGALAAYREAAAASPRHARFQLLVGQVLFNLQRHEEARAALARSLELDPDNRLTRKMMVLCLHALGRDREALDRARELVAGGPLDAETAALHGEMAETVGLVDEAVAAYVEAVRRAPERLDLMLRIGELELTAQRPGRAAYAYRQVLRQDPRLAAARLGLAKSLWQEAQADSTADQDRLREIRGLLEGLEDAGVDAASLEAWRAAIDARSGR